MRTSPLQSKRGQRAWLLQGVEMIRGTIIGVDDRFGSLTLESDGGQHFTVAHEAFAFDADGARALIQRAMDNLQRELAEIDREAAPLLHRTVRGEKYGGIDI